MKELRKLAKQLLNEAPLKSFWDIVREAKITDAEQEILDKKFIHGMSNVEISLRLNYSLEKVNSCIRKAYERVGKLLETR